MVNQKTNKFASPKMQNEMIEVMALQILRDIAKNIHLVPHEDFIGLHPIPDTSADEIIAVIKDILIRMNLKIENARGQCYDGAVSMAGKR